MSCVRDHEHAEGQTDGEVRCQAVNMRGETFWVPETETSEDRCHVTKLSQNRPGSGSRGTAWQTHFPFNRKHTHRWTDCLWWGSTDAATHRRGAGDELTCGGWPCNLTGFSISSPPLNHRSSNRQLLLPLSFSGKRNWRFDRMPRLFERGSSSFNLKPCLCV